ncbi:ribonuclease T2-like protein [Halenospora varia]|nr:ribonuclease T2-like protein [Halenospora varia]
MRFSTSSLTASALVNVSVASLYPGQSNLNHTCQLQTPLLSCSANAYPNIIDSCCTETYGGLVLSTQFWSTYTGLEAQGQKLPANTWTLHGLWPDFCNGSYTQYCDLSRQYDPLPSPNTTTGTPSGTPVVPYTGPNIGTFLEPFGKFDLLAYMNKFWIAQAQPNPDFWGHEFSKHATCFSTFDLPCYGPQLVQHAEVVDFFETAISYYQNLPTYGWLSAADIRPSNSTSYTLGDMQTALNKGFGATPYIGCAGPKWNETDAGKGSSDNGRTVLSEVWYYYHVYGRVQRNQGLPVNASINGGSLGNCAKAKGAVQYPKRTTGSEVAV